MSRDTQNGGVHLQFMRSPRNSEFILQEILHKFWGAVTVGCENVCNVFTAEEDDPMTTIFSHLRVRSNERRRDQHAELTMAYS